MRGYRPQLALAEITAVDDSGKQQTVSHYAFKGEDHSGVYRPQQFGFSSRPPKGSTGIVVSLGGERSRSVFLGGEHDDHRPRDLEEGEGKLYDASGNLIYMAGKNGTKIKTVKGDTVIENDDGKVTMKANGDVIIESARRILLGGAGATAAVATNAGYSTKVFAVL